MSDIYVFITIYILWYLTGYKLIIIKTIEIQLNFVWSLFSLFVVCDFRNSESNILSIISPKLKNEASLFVSINETKLRKAVPVGLLATTAPCCGGLFSGCSPQMEHHPLSGYTFYVGCGRGCAGVTNLRNAGCQFAGWRRLRQCLHCWLDNSPLVLSIKRIGTIKFIF